MHDGHGQRLFDREPAKIALAFLLGVLGALAARLFAMPLPFLLGPLPYLCRSINPRCADSGAPLWT